MKIEYDFYSEIIKNKLKIGIICKILKILDNKNISFVVFEEIQLKEKFVITFAGENIKYIYNYTMNEIIYIKVKEPYIFQENDIISTVYIIKTGIALYE
jgi:hypothetical protein